MYMLQMERLKRTASADITAKFIPAQTWKEIDLPAPTYIYFMGIDAMYKYIFIPQKTYLIDVMINFIVKKKRINQYSH